MEVIGDLEAARTWLRAQQRGGRTVGLVPTMGALHEGHLSLVRTAKSRCDLAVATIFVNPTQFGPNEDLNKYPRTLERDLELLREVHADLVFTPTNDMMYPPDFSTYVDPPDIAKPWEGSIRPGHFRGVTTIVLKLFNALPADDAFFGQKDFQQVAVINQMVRDLNLAIRVTTCATVRESDGLAMSSRNRYLSPAERSQALGISRALQRAASDYQDGQRQAAMLEAAMRQELTAHEISQIDYAVVCDRATLHSLPKVDRPAVLLIAARVGSTRLIDNWLLDD